jgi:Predicted membrane protein
MSLKRFLLVDTRPMITIAALALRISFALVLVVRHGFPTFVDWMNGVTEYPDPLSIGPRTTMAIMAFTELFCAALVSVGLFTRFASFLVAGGFFVAVFIHHWPDSLADKELPIHYLGSFLALMLIGPGKFSLDFLLFGKQNK